MLETAFPESFDLIAAFDAVHDHWSPRIVARVNDQYVKVAKIQGELVWHRHADEDELFYVVRGHLRMQYEDGRTAELAEGAMHVVPRNTMHNPLAVDECWIVLIETVTTKHTGDVESPRTKSIAEQLG
ncbi:MULTISPECIES: cupin domain-containing protein [Burkholderia]|uniref:cupin domain-containing protein n=1 Tax=Burkholderia TaxID=32008 RepID=UPI00075A2416|nr:MULTISPECIES: cupin domain-containing protein [Burkholderia]KVC45635.1 cupin [Burkholderia diffusa]MBR8284424.1 cupin domain-containing protein [Burkholderia vietnamiensis]QMI49059.1 cupin domain-containing protein [Burkholderia sp. MBR-1]